jgi:hypothetical protein
VPVEVPLDPEQVTRGRGLIAWVWVLGAPVLPLAPVEGRLHACRHRLVRCLPAQCATSAAAKSGWLKNKGAHVLEAPPHTNTLTPKQLVVGILDLQLGQQWKVS